MLINELIVHDQATFEEGYDPKFLPKMHIPGINLKKGAVDSERAAYTRRVKLAGNSMWQPVVGTDKPSFYDLARQPPAALPRRDMTSLCDTLGNTLPSGQRNAQQSTQVKKDCTFTSHALGYFRSMVMEDGEQFPQGFDPEELISVMKLIGPTEKAKVYYCFGQPLEQEKSFTREAHIQPGVIGWFKQFTAIAISFWEYKRLLKDGGDIYPWDEKVKKCIPFDSFLIRETPSANYPGLTDLVIVHRDSNAELAIIELKRHIYHSIDLPPQNPMRCFLVEDDSQLAEIDPVMRWMGIDKNIDVSPHYYGTTTGLDHYKWKRQAYIDPPFYNAKGELEATTLSDGTRSFFLRGEKGEKGEKFNPKERRTGPMVQFKESFTSKREICGYKHQSIGRQVGALQFRPLQFLILIFPLMLLRADDDADSESSSFAIRVSCRPIRLL